MFDRIQTLILMKWFNLMWIILRFSSGFLCRRKPKCFENAQA